MSFSQNITRAALALSVSMLAACGGGGGSAAAPASQQAPQPKPVQVSFYGDSTMAGYTYPGGPCGADGTGACDPATAVVTTDNAPHNMELTLQQMGISVAVSNNGISGAELADLIAGRHGYTQSWAQALPTLTAKIVVANYAINDVMRGDETPELFGQYLSAWVDSVRAYGMVPVLEEPNPVCRPGYEALPQYVSQIDTVAAQKSVPLIVQYSFIQSIPNWQSMLSDCVHPKPVLYEIKGVREAQVLGPLVKQLGG